MKTSKKVLAILLTIATLMGIFSCGTTVFAEEYNEYTDNKAYQEKLLTESVETEEKKAEIVCEVPEKRGEYSKTYKRADGSYTSIVSQTPLHTYEDGQWNEIGDSFEIENGEIVSSGASTYSLRTPSVTIPDFDDTIIEDTVISKGISEGDENKNFSNSIEGNIINNDTAHSEILVKLNDAVFEPFKEASVTVTDVNYYSSGYFMGGNVLVKAINGNWNSKTVTYNDVYSDNSGISYENPVIDYYIGTTFVDRPQSITVYFNITELFNQWLTGDRSNDGFVLTAENEDTEGLFILAGDYTPSSTTFEFNSFCSIDYVDTSCSNDSFEYLTQEIGRAGQASVNTFSRSLSVTRSDISMDGLRMPVSVGFNYSPAITTCLDLYKTILEIAGEDVEIDLPYGQNWCPTYLQYIFEIVEGQFQFFTEEGTLVTFNQSEETIEEIDENGNKTTETEIVFVADETSDIGYSLELIDQERGFAFENLRVTNPSGEAIYFNDIGLVSEIREAEPNSDGSYDKISITFDEENPFKIGYITDGIGRKYAFVYDNESGLLSEIKCLTADGVPIKAGTTETDLKVTYGYDDNGNLTTVTYPDGEAVTYTYESRNLTKAQNIDGYNIQYTYDSLGKVTNISEYAGTTPGNTIALTQHSNRQVKVVDGYNGTETYQFGRDGKLNYTFDERGNYLKSDYAPAKDENVYSSNEWSISSQNLLKNGSFEENSSIITNLDGAKYWSTEFETTALPEQQKENDEIIGYDSKSFGEKAYFISSENDCTDYLTQTVEVGSAASYTFSAFVRSEVAGELSLKIKAISDSGSVQNSDTVKISSTEGWERFSVTYTPENNFVPAEITVQIGFEDSKGTYYVDCAQLEKGLGTAEYNLIENGSFNNNDEYWSNSEIEADLTAIKAVKLTGGLPSYNDSELTDHFSATTQNVRINGKKGDIYSVGGWFKGIFDDNYIYENVSTQYTDLAEQLTSSSAQIKVTYSYTNSEQEAVTESFAVDFAPHNEDWQYAVDSFALKGDAEFVDVTIIAKNIPADCYATGIELTEDNDAFSFVEDEEAETSEEPEAEGEDNTTTETTTPEECPCEDCEELDCSCRCESAEACTCVQCKRRSDIEASSEDGKTVTTSSFDGEKYMQSAVTYSSDLNNVVSETDENNISSGYAYNVNGGLTSFTDGAGSETTYQSNAMGYLTLAESNVSGLTDNAVKMAISYAYDGDLLTTVNQGNVQYTYEYDEWGQLCQVLVDGKKLICYNYGRKVYRSRITNVIFGSSKDKGFTVKYTYDEKTGDIVAVEKYRFIEGEKDSITYNYKYDNLGNLDYIKDNGTGHFLDYTDEGVVIKDGQNGPVIYETKDVTPEPEEDEEISEGEGDDTQVTDNGTPEIASITQETANGTSYNHKIYESDYSEETGKSTENEAVSVVMNSDNNGNFTYGKIIGTQTLSDWFGRNEAVTVMTKDPVDTATTDFASISSQYSYVTKNNITTNLISSVTNTITGEEENTVNYNYTYDSNERITNASTVSSVPNFSGSSQYVYDEAGQLIREITGSTTYEYAYDSKGNITTRKVYSGETLTKTDTFTYNTESWEDRLTGYNNKTITYDSIGNPTSYLGATLSWRGRELAGYSKGNKQISYSYDVDGMRYRKVVEEDNKKSTYDYVYSDGTLILLTYTANGVSNTARFVYDSFGEPRGFMLNDSATYLYLKNAQGDITGIVDENGAVLLTYSYNSWGKVSFTATDMESMALAATLSNVNPFTYRGYCYDFDIKMYYLQSRYYDPEICRFINADSTDYLGATGTLLSYNLFAYCENDSVNRVDEDGRSWKDLKEALKSIGVKVKSVYKKFSDLTSSKCTEIIKKAKKGYSIGKTIKDFSKKIKKTLENCTDDVFQHVRDVVNIGYFENKGKKGYQAIYRKSYGINEKKLYNYRYSVYEAAWLYLLAAKNCDMLNKKWIDLSEDCQLELINMFASWDKKVALNIGRYYGAEVGEDVIVTSVKLGIKFVKVK